MNPFSILSQSASSLARRMVCIALLACLALTLSGVPAAPAQGAVGSQVIISNTTSRSMTYSFQVDRGEFRTFTIAPGGFQRHDIPALVEFNIRYFNNRYDVFQSFENVDQTFPLRFLQDGDIVLLLNGSLCPWD